MSAPNGFGGVTECYAFKSRLQEYGQKANFITPVYETSREGPSHEPLFRSTVTVNGVRYDSLPGFHNRKTAEQSAAEMALLQINVSRVSEHVMYPVPILHETGLCKNLLQEYAQKMNYAIPTYACSKVPSDRPAFTCRVDIGNISYIGATAKSKKEAEIKAARTALLAIQLSSGANETRDVSQLSVLPGKRKGKEIEVKNEILKPLKPKKASFKKKMVRKNNAKQKNRLMLNKNLNEEALHGETDTGGQNTIVERLESNEQVLLTQHEKSGGADPNECGSNYIPNDLENSPISSCLFTQESNGQIQNTQPTFANNVGSNLESCPIVNGNILKVDDSHEKPKECATSVIPCPTSSQKIENYESSVMLNTPVDLPVKEEEKTLLGEVDVNLDVDVTMKVPCDHILTGANETRDVSQLSVLPGKRKGKEIEVKNEILKPLKPKKASFKKKMVRKNNAKQKNRLMLNKNLNEEALHGETDTGGQNTIVERLESNEQVLLTQHEKSGGADPNECGSNYIPNDLENSPISSCLFTQESNGQIQNTQPTFANNVGSNLESCPIVNGNILKVDDSHEKPKECATSVIPCPTSSQKIENYESSVMLNTPVDLPVKEEEKTLLGEVDVNLDVDVTMKVPCDHILTGSSTHQTSPA